jgi:hypothetical protein
MTPGAEGSTGCAMFHLKTETEETVVDLFWDTADAFTVGTLVDIVRESRK